MVTMPSQQYSVSGAARAGSLGLGPFGVADAGGGHDTSGTLGADELFGTAGSVLYDRVPPFGPFGVPVA